MTYKYEFLRDDGANFYVVSLKFQKPTVISPFITINSNVQF